MVLQMKNVIQGRQPHFEIFTKYAEFYYGFTCTFIYKKIQKQFFYIETEEISMKNASI